jgi:hypothetical protein
VDAQHEGKPGDTRILNIRLTVARPSCRINSFSNSPVISCIAMKEHASNLPGGFRPVPRNRLVTRGAAGASLGLLLASALCLNAASEKQTPTGTWPQTYSVQRDNAAGILTLNTPYYEVRHDLRKGGAIASIRLTHGHAPNLLAQPLGTRVCDETGTVFADVNDPAARVSHRKDGSTEIVSVECQPLAEQGRESGLRLKTVFEYHWGYIKIRKELAVAAGSFRARELCLLATVLAPSLSDFGYREGLTESEGAPPFSFGSCRWGKLSVQNPSKPLLKTTCLPRYLMVAEAGVEGLEWFMGSDLSQWDLQITGRRGQGQCLLQAAPAAAGFALSISPFQGAETPVSLPKALAFDCYLGLPILSGQARKPWFHASFNRNRGEWVTKDQARRWAETGFQTVHCHNDGDYYSDGLFWRDGAYPPYPDMGKFDQVVEECHRNGLRVATYFSNKELHPSTREFQLHGSEWGRQNRPGNLQHNFYREKSEFGVQMCLRSGWPEFLKSSIDRVLTNHPLDGVYYDWNVALFCCNARHEGKPAGVAADGHWDIDELLNLMEWTRRRVGPSGLVIIHNTTTPMFATENFADFVVANEWGYGKWTDNGPDLQDLPLEWSLVGARSRGVISYGQISAGAPKRLHRLFALEALLDGVTPWPASPETFELFSILKPIGDLESCRFVGWRNQAVVLQGRRCASAIYSRPAESFLLLANLEKDPQEVRCTVRPDKLPYPLAAPVAAALLSDGRRSIALPEKDRSHRLDIGQLIRDGVTVTIPADSAVLLQVR